MSACPVSACPVSACPVSACPVSACPVSACPVSACPVSACPVSACPVSASLESRPLMSASLVSASSLPTPQVGGGRGWGVCAVAVSECLGRAWRRQDCRCGSGTPRLPVRLGRRIAGVSPGTPPRAGQVHDEQDPGCRRCTLSAPRPPFGLAPPATSTSTVDNCRSDIAEVALA
ncbi:Cys-every-fifth RiPP peptide CefA [Microtetraspora malaysiensis]|uniref:Cys-every-fifth RiPP peptide CefA n=1 Tax=Microtetraspora malaysiensis TaxID=161358 RepID=UPI003D8A5A7E